MAVPLNTGDRLVKGAVAAVPGGLADARAVLLALAVPAAAVQAVHLLDGRQVVPHRVHADGVVHRHRPLPLRRAATESQ